MAEDIEQPESSSEEDEGEDLGAGEPEESEDGSESSEGSDEAPEEVNEGHFAGDPAPKHAVQIKVTRIEMTPVPNIDFDNWAPQAADLSSKITLPAEYF